MKEIKFDIISQGSAYVNFAYAEVESERIVAAGIDLKERHCKIEAYHFDGDIPGICISDDGGEDTVVMFPEYKGWNIHSASISKYTLHICFVKNS